MTRVSVLINNYNYGRFLADCIDSALAQGYEHTEIIVVDDGSTDDSDEVLKQYADRISIIQKANGGQGSAYNAGFEKSLGDIVIFLDSDDVLNPDVVELAVGAFSDSSVAKVQWRLRIIDDRGAPIGGVFPSVLHSGSVSKIIENFGMYGSPPGSGNAFRRSAIADFFPLDETLWQIAADTVPVVVAPFNGKVITLAGVGGGYRIHDKSHHSDEFVLNNSPSRPSDAVRLAARSRAQVFDMLKGAGFILAPFLFEMPAQVKLRLISLKALPREHPVQGDTLLRILSDAWASICCWPGFTFKKRWLYGVWFLVVAIAPTELSKKIILRSIRFARKAPTTSAPV